MQIDTKTVELYRSIVIRGSAICHNRLDRFPYVIRVQWIICNIIVIAKPVLAGSFASVQTYYGYALDTLHVLVLV